MGSRLLGVAALVATTLLWGSSFPLIKLVVDDVGDFAYTWMRGAIASAALAPYVALAALRGRLEPATLRGGLLTGVAYTLGLWLQGWGTGLTTASKSAFLTALHMVWVHVYVALVTGSYPPRLAASLAAALAGVYLLSGPLGGGFNLGDALVLAGSFMWAAQVILVDKYSRGDPLQFTFAQISVSMAFIVPDYLDGGIEAPGARTLAMLAYLALLPGVAAFALQVWGQRHVGPETAAIIYQLEPFFAAGFSRVLLGEALTARQWLGALLIAAAVATAEYPRFRAASPLQAVRLQEGDTGVTR